MMQHRSKIVVPVRVTYARDGRLAFPHFADGRRHGEFYRIGRWYFNARRDERFAAQEAVAG